MGLHFAALVMLGPYLPGELERRSRHVIQKKESYRETGALWELLAICLHKGRVLSPSQKRGAFLVFLEISGESFLIVYMDVPIWTLQPNYFFLSEFLHISTKVLHGVSRVWKCPQHYASILCVTFNGVLQLTSG